MYIPEWIVVCSDFAPCNVLVSNPSSFLALILGLLDRLTLAVSTTLSSFGITTDGDGFSFLFRSIISIWRSIGYELDLHSSVLTDNEKEALLNFKRFAIAWISSTSSFFIPEAWPLYNMSTSMHAWALEASGRITWTTSSWQFCFSVLNSDVLSEATNILWSKTSPSLHLIIKSFAQDPPDFSSSTRKWPKLTSFSFARVILGPFLQMSDFFCQFVFQVFWRKSTAESGSTSSKSEREISRQIEVSQIRRILFYQHQNSWTKSVSNTTWKKTQKKSRQFSQG